MKDPGGPTAQRWLEAGEELRDGTIVPPTLRMDAAGKREAQRVMNERRSLAS